LVYHCAAIIFYRSGPSREWIRVKNPDGPAMVRMIERLWCLRTRERPPPDRGRQGEPWLDQRARSAAAKAARSGRSSGKIGWRHRDCDAGSKCIGGRSRRPAAAINLPGTNAFMLHLGGRCSRRCASKSRQACPVGPGFRAHRALPSRPARASSLTRSADGLRLADLNLLLGFAGAGDQDRNQNPVN